MVIIGPVTRKIWTVCKPKSSWGPEKRQLPFTSHIGGGCYGPTAPPQRCVLCNSLKLGSANATESYLKMRDVTTPALSSIGRCLHLSRMHILELLTPHNILDF